MSMSRFKAVIFDMDGVIVDSEPHHERAFLDVFERIGYGLTHGIHFPSYYGRSDLALWLDFVAVRQPPFALEDLVRWKDERFMELILSEQPIFETLPELVACLSRRCKLGVASGSCHSVINAVLAMKNLRRHFKAVVSVEDVPKGKPAPDLFLRTAEMLGTAPAECCVIEDAAAGVEAALAAGMEVIAITNSLPREKLARATHVVGSYLEIEKLLLGSSTGA